MNFIETGVTYIWDISNQQSFILFFNFLSWTFTIPRSSSGGAPHRLMIAQQESKAAVEKLRKLEEELLVEEGMDGTNMFNKAVDEEMKLYENI